MRALPFVRAFAAAWMAAFAIACGPTPVEPPPPLPPNVSLSAPPLASVEKGVTLTKTISGANTCTSSWRGSIEPRSGEETYAPPSVGVVEFLLSCTGPGGTREARVTVRFINEPVAVITPDTTVNLELGNSAQLQWECRNSAPTAQSWAAPPFEGVQGSFTFTPSSEGYFKLMLECGNELGTARDSALVFAYAPAGQRTTVDRPDGFPGPKVKVVYMLSADGPDLSRDTDGTICSMVLETNGWFAGQTKMVLALDTYGSCPDVLYHRSKRTNAENEALSASMAWLFYSGLVEAGLVDSLGKYIFLYEGTNTYACGSAGVDGPAAGLYLMACSSGGLLSGLKVAFLHEFGHMVGVVDPKAPHHDARSPFHTTDSCWDIMHGGNPAGGCEPGGTLAVDPGCDDWFCDSLPGGIRNAKLSRWLVIAPPGAVAQAAGLRAEWRRPMFEFREILESRRP